MVGASSRPYDRSMSTRQIPTRGIRGETWPHGVGTPTPTGEPSPPPNPAGPPRGRVVCVSATRALVCGILPLVGYLLANAFAFRGLGEVGLAVGMLSAPTAVVTGAVAVVQIGRSGGRLRGGGRAGFGIALGVLGLLVTPIMLGLAAWTAAVG